MQPDFNQKTIDILARRAAYKCSNPDCRILTVGPNSEVDKSTVIGEAAHIFGARQSSKRYYKEMTDLARAEITNSIWLCRNCHKLIDTDDKKYTSEILFAWREQHEKYTQSELGSATDRIQYENQLAKLSTFNNYPPMIRRIVIDKPDGWEWRLAAELMRYFNGPLFRKLEDLKDGLYVKSRRYIADEEVFKLVKIRMAETSSLVAPFSVLLDRLTKSFGPPGVPGDEEEIHHITSLIRDHLSEIVRYEEEINFLIVADKYKNIIDLLKNILGSQAIKLAEIPETLDEIDSLIGKDHEGTTDKPLVIRKTITLDLPDRWEKKFDKELNRAFGGQVEIKKNTKGCLPLIVFVMIIFLIIKFL